MTKFVESCNVNFLNNKILDIIPNDEKNIMFYGCYDAELYAHAVNHIKTKSPSSLSYDKKIIVTFNNDDYIYRISDVHIEINFEFLGCIAKNLWAAIFSHIEELAASKHFTVLCRNFCSVNNELIDNFYTYMNQSNISFVFLVHNISCLPKELVDACHLIPLKRVANSKLKKERITHTYVEKVFELITNTFNVKIARNMLYDILIYQIDVYDLFYQLLKKINSELNPSDEKKIKLLIEVNIILKLFNNNYRSIYHLENMILSMITILS